MRSWWLVESEEYPHEIDVYLDKPLREAIEVVPRKEYETLQLALDTVIKAFGRLSDLKAKDENS